MSTGKRFKKKVNNPKSGQCFWRVHGVPLPTDYNETNVSKYAARFWTTYVVYENKIFYAERFFAKGKPARYNVRNGKHSVIMYGTLERYFKNEKSAGVYLAELKNGFHQEAVNDNHDFHSRMDMLDEVWNHGFNDEPEYDDEY